MSSKRERILTSLKTRLDTVSLATGGVYRSRVFALSRAQNPAIALEPVSDQPSPEDPIGFIDWDLLVRVAVIVRGDVPDQLADPIVLAAHAAVCADLSLGGLSMDITPASVSFELIDGDLAIGVISLGYRIKYRTSVTDLAT
jgi:hypothetical protein